MEFLFQILLKNNLRYKKYENPTMYTKHLADSANFKVVTFNKIYNGLTGLLSEMPNVSYTNRCAPLLNDNKSIKMIFKK